MKSLVKAVAVLLLAVLALAAWAYGQALTATFFPVVSPRPYSEMLACALAGAIAAALVSAVPLGALFGPRAWLVALAFAAPMAMLRLPELFSYSGTFSHEVKVMASVELLSFTLAVVGGAWLASRYWPGPNSTLKNRRPSGAA